MESKINVHELAGEICKQDFYFFVQEFWSVIIAEEPVWNWHIKYLCDTAQKIVERIARREDKTSDLVVNIPPGTSKSTIFTIMLPAWAWVLDPSLRVLTISYSDTLATEHAVKSRDIIQSDQYQNWFPHIRIKKDKNNKTNYENEANGQRLASGLGGSITGMHAHLIIIDDPLNPKQAASEEETATANRTIDNTLSTRKVNKEVTVTMLIMQRLHENDPTGHLLAKKDKEVTHIKLPAEVSDGVLPERLAAFYVNGLLDQKRLSKKSLIEAGVDLGSANYSGQFAQNPTPAGGLIWKKWFKEIPDSEFPFYKIMSLYGTDWDLAYTKKDKNAASAYITGGKIGENIFIDDLGWDWLEFPPLIKWIKSKHAPHYIEAKASGISAKQTLVEEGVVAIEVTLDGSADKEARAKMASPVAEAGMVFIRQSLADKLYNDSKQGILNFPRGKYKDLADVLSQFLLRLRRKGVHIIGAGAHDRDSFLGENFD